LGAPSGRKNMHDFALGAKCGALGASGSAERSDDSAPKRPSCFNNEASARAPSPEALEVKNWRRAKSIFVIGQLSAVGSQWKLPQQQLPTDNGPLTIPS